MAGADGLIAVVGRAGSGTPCVGPGEPRPPGEPATGPATFESAIGRTVCDHSGAFPGCGAVAGGLPLTGAVGFPPLWCLTKEGPSPDDVPFSPGCFTPFPPGASAGDADMSGFQPRPTARALIVATFSPY